MREASALYRLLGDEARLRLLRALTRERLNVTELTGVLGLAQSGVSRHLGLLKDAGLVLEERDGGVSYYLCPPICATGRWRGGSRRRLRGGAPPPRAPAPGGGRGGGGGGGGGEVSP